MPKFILLTPLFAALLSIAPLQPQPEVAQNQSIEKVLDRENVFTLTDQTPISEFVRIKTMAEAAGIKCKMKTAQNGTVLKQFSMKLKVGSNKYASNNKVDGKFKITIGWTEDDAGNAIRLYRKPR